jgi:MerR family transcriptional regulator, copper efflux regulator
VILLKRLPRQARVTKCINLEHTAGFKLGSCTMRLRTIGELAKAAGVAVDTVRYYERIGLLPPRRGRAATGWRRYPEEILVRLRYVREGRAVGFTLREMRNLLNLTVAGRPRFCEAFDDAVNRKICAIDQVVARLTAQRARLEQFSRACGQRRKEGRCPILESLGRPTGRRTPVWPAG